MTNHPIIFYDGVCGLCDRSVQFLIKHDNKRKLRYATLQSTLAKSVLGKDITFDSFIYYNQNKIYQRSSGALMAAKQLGGWWKLTGIFWMVPRFLRDGIYDWIAQNRYQWFGKYDSCKIPTPEQKTLFLDI